MDQKLKQRLVGAIVLVSLAVIFIPVILEGPRDEWTPRAQNIPPPPEMSYGDPSPLRVPEPVTPRSVPVPGNASGDQATPGDIPVPGTVAPPPAPVAETTPPAPADLPHGWYVQVASFSQPDNADRLRERLQAAGLEAARQSVDTAGGPGFRVLVGPVASRAAADKLQQQIAGDHKLQGIIIGIGEPEGE